ncbi:MAG: transcriptional regulator [Myxococcota bacterium]
MTRSAPRKPPVPVERGETVRETIRSLLRHGPLTARELSVQVQLREKDVAEHLERLARSARGRGERFRVVAATCRRCGFEFGSRAKLTRPSRCPACSSERIEGPAFLIEGGEETSV